MRNSSSRDNTVRTRYGHIKCRIHVLGECSQVRASRVAFVDGTLDVVEEAVLIPGRRLVQADVGMLETCHAISSWT